MLVCSLYAYCSASVFLLVAFRLSLSFRGQSCCSLGSKISPIRVDVVVRIMECSGDLKDRCYQRVQTKLLYGLLRDGNYSRRWVVSATIVSWEVYSDL